MKQNIKNTAIIRLKKGEQIRIMVDINSGYERSFAIPPQVRFIEIYREKK